ncbi:MAG: oxidoreductase [Acidobacteria bacterium]|nr:oxidoreductase [Acidobacteriota bacterium]
MIAASLAGATGLTGGHLLNLLLDHGDFDPVVSCGRRPLQRNHPRLRDMRFDFAEQPRIDVAFCCLGTTIRKAGSQEAFRAVDHALVTGYARWARACGARQFLLVSSVMASQGSPNFYLRVKAETENAIEGLGFESLDIFQPSFLLGHRGEYRRGERAGQAVVEVLQFALLGPLERFRGVSGGVLAKAMLNRALKPAPGVHRHEWGGIVALAA